MKRLFSLLLLLSFPLGAASEQLGILTPPPGKEPRINGPKVLALRPQHEMLWRVPVTGEAPLTLSVKGLPEGLTFDPEKRLLGGTAARGEYALTFTAENQFGKSEQIVKVKVGDKLALTPPMGWNSWNCFAGKVTGEDIKNAADALISSGLADHGWNYINIDDFWQNRPREKEDETLMGPERAADGTILSNKRFPSMKELADYIHSKGLRAGLYSSPGPLTCGGCVGSWGHEWQDAKTYADWGFDYLKYDWCSYNRIAMGDEALEKYYLPYRLMGEALFHQNRDIVFSLCEAGYPNVSNWGPLVYSACWRTTSDISGSFNSMARILKAQEGLWRFASPGAWNDPDMLIVGVIGWGDPKPTKLTPNEQYTHVSLWAMLCAPLLIGCDLTKLDDFTLSLLTNDEIIEVNQDELGAQAAKISASEEGEIWAKPMSDGSLVFALYNSSKEGEETKTLALDFEKLGLLGEWRVRDLWRQKELGICRERYTASVPCHATQVVRLFPVGEANLKPELKDIRDLATYNFFRVNRNLNKPGLE